MIRPRDRDELAEAVADCVLRRLTIRNYRPLPTPPSGPEAAAAYHKAAEARDRLVPEAYRRSTGDTFRVPENADAWNERRPDVLKTVLKSLGDLPPRPSPPRGRVVSRELRPGYFLEKIAIDNGVDGFAQVLGE